MTERTVDASDFGLSERKRSDLTANTIEESIGLVRGVLEGRNSSDAEQAARTVVLMNAAAALVAVGQADSFEQGAAQASESVDSGKALGKLESLVSLTRELGGG